MIVTNLSEHPPLQYLDFIIICTICSFSKLVNKFKKNNGREGDKIRTVKEEKVCLKYEMIC